MKPSTNVLWAPNLTKSYFLPPQVYQNSLELLRFHDCLLRTLDCFCLGGVTPYAPRDEEWKQVLNLTYLLYKEIQADREADVRSDMKGKPDHYEVVSRAASRFNRLPHRGYLQTMADQEVMRDWERILHEHFKSDDEEVNE